ncbi:MAG TPA: tetratricopeptide repeat protein [Candidatus Binatia bacterium]|nr:tetratricopeptide repeat protein [Candidatus Binatia bacterium]
MRGSPIEEIRARLYEIARAGDGDVAEGALLIAAEEYPDLDLGRYLGFIDDAAEAARARVADGAAPDEVRRALAQEIFERRRFAGDDGDYYDPRNSYLNDVIDRRRGIPITLAIVYLAAGRRLDQPVAGVNAPGHFLVRHGETILDAFHGGRVVSRDDLVKQLGEMKAADPAAVADQLLAEPPTPGAILTRVLANLKANYLRRRDLPRALRVVDRLVQMNPDQPQWLRDRGALYQRLDCPHAAIADLERYCELVPDDPEGEVVRAALVQLMRNAPTLQ